MIKRGEEKKVFLFLIFFGILMMGIEMGRGLSASLFLTNVGIEKLPAMLLIASIVNTLAVISYMALSANRDNRTLFSIILWTGALLIIPSRFIFKGMPGLTSYIIYAGSEFLNGAIALHFSVYIADYFNTRQSKRLFPIIFSGSRVGGIIGGMVLTFATVPLGSLNLLIIWASAIGAGLLLMNYIDRVFPPEVFDYDQHSRESSKFFHHIKSSLEFLKGSMLLKSLATGVFLLGFLSLIMKFLYSGIFVETFPDTDKLTAFFGLYTIASNLLGLFIQVVIANKLIDSMGLGAANITYAIALVSSFFSMGFFHGFPSALWARFTDEQLESAIREPVESMLYNAVPDNERARARALSSGLIKPVSEISGSAFLHFTKTLLGAPQIALFGLSISAIFVVVTFLQNKGYVEGLMTMVRDKTLNLEDLENLRWEKASRSDLDKLYRMATGKDETVRDSAVVLLLNLDEDIDFDILKASFFDWSDDIKSDFLLNYFKRCKGIDKGFLQNAMENSSTPVRILIIEYFIEGADGSIRAYLENHLSDQSDLLLQNSVIRYFYLLDSQDRQTAVEIIKHRFSRDDHHIIHANLGLIRDLFDESYLDYVRRLTYHPHRNIAIDAINTLALIYQPRVREEPEIISMVEDLISRGGYHELKAAVMIMGKRPGKQVQQELLRLLDTGSAPLRESIIEVLSGNHPDDTELYLEILDSRAYPLLVRENIVKLLKQINRKIEPERLKEILKGLVQDYFELTCEIDWLQKNNFSACLISEMNFRKRNHIRFMILEILEILLHKKVVISIEKALVTKNPRLIANALELFENLWDKKQGKDLITLLYPESFEEELAIGSKFIADREINIDFFLKKYLSPDLPRWDICAALMLIREASVQDIESRVFPYLNHHDPLVREISTAIGIPIDSERDKDDMLTTIEKVICLKNAPLFKSLKMEELKMVADICRERTYSPGEDIIEKGELGDAMFVIASGKVEIFLPGEKRQILTVLKESDFFGEMALFDEEVRSASVKALENTKLLSLERNHFLNLIYEKPDISVEIIKVLSERLRRMDAYTRNSKAEQENREKESS